MIRRRYVVKVYHPDDYAPHDVRKFRALVDVAEFIKAERTGRPWLVFNVADRKTGKARTMYDGWRSLD